MVIRQQNNTTTKHLKTNKMNKKFIPYEQALALQRLGFDEECFGTWFELEGKYSIIIRNNLYRNDLQTPSPLYQQAFRWFREKHGLNYVIIKAESWFYTINGCNTQEGFKTYEEAELDCLKKLIEIVKSK